MTVVLLPPPPGTTLLGRLVARREDAEQAERDVVTLAVDYAALHPAPGASEDDSLHGDQPLELAGAGAPGVSEFAVTELAAALGMSTEAGRRYLGAALELAHRLPQIWQRVLTGEVVAWRARRVAEQTIGLSEAGAAYVDAKVAARVDKIGPITLSHLVEEARLLAEEPEEDATLDLQARRRATVDTRSAAVHGIGYLDAVLDTTDALDLEQALQTAAAQLKQQDNDRGNDQPLDIRRSQALGLIARHYLTTTGTTDGGSGGGIQLYVHYAPDSDLGRRDRIQLENTRGLSTLDQITEWLSRPGVTVKVTPVIDLAETLTTTGYVPSPRLREQVILRDATCAFPRCTKQARRVDLDHIEPYGPGGPPGQTSSLNLACLCRGHHRIKTHDNWTYRMLDPGTYLWRSPAGRRYLRTPTGTIALT